VAPSYPLTLMAVHAHPDDEASSTGGILARYSAEGIRTVVVCCTNGELGDAPGGTKPGEAGHDEAEVVAVRKRELAASCERLGVGALEMLGYHDSGMMGWPQNEAPGSFWSMPVEEAARPLVALMERYRSQVVVTYDSNGFYGHPDHIQAHRITLHAAAEVDSVEKIYFPVIPRSKLPEFAAALAEAGVEPPEATAEDNGGVEFGTPDELVHAQVDCSSFVDQKFDALSAHTSQIEDTFFLKMGREGFDRFFGVEFFQRHLDRTGSEPPESDLFAGLR
jgi:LmbE family N-acetylglucosaminyl deacetylase